MAMILLLALAAACARDDAESDKPMTIEERGRVAFSECAVCHSVKDPSAPGYAKLVGPSLFGVYGAPAAHQADYDYSKAMRDSNLVWDDATLDAYIENPHKLVPGTRMSFAGEPDANKRAAILAFLKTLK